MIKVTLYNYTGHRNTINKTLTNETPCLGVFRDSTNLLNPVLIIRVSSPVTFNYVYVDEFKRFYFIDGVRYIMGDKCELSLKVDVLQTYKEQILKATATVTETDKPDTFASNRENIYSRKPNFEKLEFPNKDLFNDTGSIIMVTIKGTKQDTTTPTETNTNN